MNLFEDDRLDGPAETAVENHNQHATSPDDGIYFGMPDREYHAIERLSASGIKDLLISLPWFWANSWLNPDRENDDTDAKIIGRAYHTAFFEPEELGRRFVRKPDWSDFPGILMRSDDVKAALKEMGQPMTKTGEKALDTAYRLKGLGYTGPIKSVIEAEFHRDLDDREALDARVWDQIGTSIDRLKENEEIAKALDGGAAEVAILWTCPDTGIAMKAKIDKLKADRFLDLKSFANKSGKNVRIALRDFVQYYKVYLQMRVYQQAIAAAKTLPIMNANIKTEWHDLIDAVQAVEGPLPPTIIFQEKGGVPNIVARRLKLQDWPQGTNINAIGALYQPGDDREGRVKHKMSDTVLCRKADMEIMHAKRMFSQAMEIYGPNAVWYPFDQMGDIGDEDFPDWFLDEVPG